MSFFGEVSPHLIELAKRHAGAAHVYSFVGGLGSAAHEAYGAHPAL